MRAYDAVLGLGIACLCLGHCTGTLFSQTTEYTTVIESTGICPDSPNDLWIKVGDLNFTQYLRQHKLAHPAHKRLMDNSEIRRLPVSPLASRSLASDDMC